MKIKGTILDRLRGGDLRSIGRANDVAQDVCNNPRLVSYLIEGISSGDPVVRARSADALEKASSTNPELVQPYKKEFIREFSRIEQQEVRWHVALILPRFQLTKSEVSEVAALLFKWLEDDTSNIVRVSSLQSLTDISRYHQVIERRVLKALKHYETFGTPSLRARAKKLLKMHPISALKRVQRQTK